MTMTGGGLGCLDFPNLLHAGSCNAQVEGSGGERKPPQTNGENSILEAALLFFCLPFFLG